MSTPDKPKQNMAAKPTRTLFDPWNSSSSGHQRAENRLGGSTSWRESRSLKLGEQFGSGTNGGRRLADTVGAGSEHFGKDGRLENGGWERGASGLRTSGQKSILESFQGVSVRKEGVQREQEKKQVTQQPYSNTTKRGEGDARDDLPQQHYQQQQQKNESQVFAGLTIYINGSTAPLVSDHKLKHLLVAHGARISIALGRRSVTHVVLGHPNGSSHAAGAGGGLAASKIEKEVARIGGKNIRFVTAEWVLESVKAGRRVPEGRYEALRMAPKGTANLMGMFAAKAGRSASQA